MKIDQINKKNLITMVDTVSEETLSYTLVPIQDTDLLVVRLGNDHYNATIEDIADIQADFQIANKKYGLKAAKIYALKDGKMKVNLDVGKMKSFPLIVDKFPISKNMNISEHIGMYITNKIKFLDRNIIIIQIGSNIEPMPGEKRDYITQESFKYLVPGIENNLKGLCIHNCLSLEAYRN